MDQIIKEVLSTGSPLAILVVIVWLFLRFIEKQGEAFRLLFQSINEQNLLARKETQVALMENAESTRENTRALNEVRIAVSKMTNHV